MKLQDIKAGHIARSNNGGAIVYIGINCGIFLSGYSVGFSYDLSYFTDDYKDLGKLNFEVKEVRSYEVKVSVK